MHTALTRTIQVSHNECFEYQKALRAMPHTQVILIQGISMTIAQLFVTPLGTIGEKLSEFFAGTMRHVPVVTWPILIVLISIFLFLLLLMSLQYEISLPFLLFSLRPAPKHAISKTFDALALENELKDSKKTIEDLQSNIKDLEQKNLALQNTAKLMQHVNPTSSDGRIALQREHSSSSERESMETKKDELIHGEISLVDSSQSSTIEQKDLQVKCPLSNQQTNSERHEQEVPSNSGFPDDFKAD
ncbi:unnamed protein product [Rotaria sp. Silwood2]|nr:unnamed protein product [Rotaria sp. Silwood2]